MNPIYKITYLIALFGGIQVLIYTWFGKGVALRVFRGIDEWCTGGSWGNSKVGNSPPSYAVPCNCRRIRRRPPQRIRVC